LGKEGDGNFAGCNMPHPMKTRIRIVSALLLMFSALTAQAQNINYTINIAELKANADNNDGGGFAGSQEPTWFIWVMDNGTTPTSLTAWQATGCIHTSNAFGTWWTGNPSSGPTIPFAWQNVTNTNATTILTEMEGFENDCSSGCAYESTGPFLSSCWINGDDNFDSRASAGNITIQSAPPCVTTQYEIQRGDYFARLDIRWEFVSIDPGSVAGTQSICSGGDPVAFTSTAAGTPAVSPWVSYQWQQDVGCTGVFADIPGATSATYDPPAGQTITTCFRRKVTDGCLDAFSNTLTVTVITASVGPSSITADPSAVCGTSGIVNLTANGGLPGTGADYAWYDGDPAAGGVLLGTGNPLNGVTINGTTDVYVRIESPCGNTGSVSTTITIAIPPTDPTGITATQTTICNGDQINLQVTGGSLGTNGQWAWYDVNPTTGNPAPLSTSTSTLLAGVSPTVTTTYFVRAEACDTTAAVAITIIVNSLSTDPTGVTATSNSVCSGSPTTLSVTGGLLGTGADWFWYQSGCGAGTPIGTGTAVTVSPTATTTYFVRAQGTCNNTTCASITITVESLSTDPLAVIPTATNVCPGNFSVLTVAGGSLGSGASWQWYSGVCGGLPVGTGNAITVTPATTTSYFVRAEGLCNTTNCATVSVTVDALSAAPAAPTSSASNICPGQSVTLTANGGTLGAGATYEWYSSSCGGIYIGSGNTITVSPTATTTYFSRIEGTCNTTACESVTVIVDPVSTAPTTVSATSTAVCAGDPSTLTVSGGSLATNDQYVWYEGGCGSGAAIGTGTSITVSPTAATSYYVRAEGPCGNTLCASVSISLNTPSTDPTAVVSTVTSVCVGQSSVLSVSGGALGTGAGWVWYSGSCGGAAVGTGNSIAVTPLATTTYFVRAEGTCGNSNCASITITVGAGVNDPTAATVITNNICPGDATSIFVTGQLLPANYTWVWYTGACGAVPVGVGETLSVSPTATTTYYVAAVGTCGSTACESATVTVLDGSVAADGITASANNFCSGNSTTLTVTGGSLTTGANWVWYENSCGGTAVGTGTSITVSPEVSTSYFVRAEGGTCGNTACVSVSITVIEHHVYVVPPDPICGSSAPFELNTGIPVGGTYSGTGVSGGYFNPQTAGPGAHPVTYTHTDQFGCTSSATADVVINPTDLTATFEITTLPCAEGGVVVELSAEGSGGYFTYYWSDGSTDNPRYYVQEGTYTVTVRDGFDCEFIIDEFLVTDQMDCIEIPNSFTPNGDGKNDTWNVDLTQYSSAVLKVYSRWGRVVFETSELDIHWDGKSNNGQDLPANTYYYTLELNGGNTTQNGPITLLR
jgi:gliding motility-associated-like protein